MLIEQPADRWQQWRGPRHKRLHLARGQTGQLPVTTEDHFSVVEVGMYRCAQTADPVRADTDDVNDV